MGSAAPLERKVSWFANYRFCPGLLHPRHLCPSPVQGIGSGPDSRWDNVRDNMGYIRDYADRLNLAAMAPRGDLSSTHHALVSAASAHPEFLIYAPSGGNFTVNLSSVDGLLAVEWMNPADRKS